MAGLPNTKNLILFYKGRFNKTVKLLFFVISFLFISNPEAVGGAGTTGAEFLKVNVGGRASAFGGAYAAVSGDVYSSQYNPAGLAKLEKKEITFMHNEWMIDTRYEFLAVGVPVKEGALAVSGRYFDMGSFIGRSSLGHKTDDFTATDASLSLSYGKPLSILIDLGLTLTYIKQSIASETSQGFAADMGLNFNILEDQLTFAFVSRNMGPKLSAFDKEEMKLPQTYVAGISLISSDKTLLVTGDLIMPNESESYLAAGAEYDVLGIMDLRAGMNFGSDRESDFNFTVGMGINIWGYSLDYCFEPVKDLDSSHRVSLSVKF